MAQPQSNVQLSPQTSANSGATSTVTVKPTQEECDRQPWRYRGYPAMCTWMASDDDFFVLRRFGKLGARVALQMQDHIVRLEEDLQNEDRQCRESGESSGTFRHDPSPKRQEILEELTGRIGTYQRYLLDHAQLKSTPDATSFQIRNVKRWLINNNGPVLQKEVDFIDKDGDLIPVVAKQKTPLRLFMDKFDFIRQIRFFRRDHLKSSHYNHPDNYESNTTIYNKDSLIDKVVTCVTIALGLAMLIGPLWLLQHVSNDPSLSSSRLQLRLTIITVFVAAFTIFMSILTKAHTFEVLAATAAYSAVLMVFMQLNSIAASGGGGGGGGSSSSNSTGLTGF